MSHNEAHRYYCIFFKVSLIIDWFPHKMESHYHGVVHGCSACFVSVHYFRLSCFPKSCWHSTQCLCLTMRLIDIIAYFSRYHVWLILFPTNWSFITMWLSMNALLVSSVSIVFGDHVSLNLADIPHNFCVSQWGSSILLHTFQSISHHWLIFQQIGFSLPDGCPWKQYLFRQ